MGIGSSSVVGRKPTVSPVRTITVPLGAEHLAALEAFQRREGISNLTEALRIALWRFLVAEGLASTTPTPAPPPKRSTLAATRGGVKRSHRPR
jgi:hypothetical protein